MHGRGYEQVRIANREERMSTKQNDTYYEYLEEQKKMKKTKTVTDLIGKCIICGKYSDRCDCVNTFTKEVEELMKFPDVKIKPYAWVYSKGDYKIYVRLVDGKLSIRTKDDDDVFEFKKSKPETVRAIAELLLSASNMEEAK